MRWTRKSIIAEINRLHEAGEPLNYSTAETTHLNLVRAAAWHFGTWRHAVEAAGINYESLSRYQRWSKPRIVERIRDLHKQKQDLSWRAVSTQIDPRLAAAALRPGGYKSWREAVTAAGIDVEGIARYKVWDEARVLKAIRARKRAGAPMFSKSLQTEDQGLFCAARRRFGSWDAALSAAGLNVEKIRLRRHNAGLNAPRVGKSATIQTTEAKTDAQQKSSAKTATSKNKIAKTSTSKAGERKTAVKSTVKSTVKADGKKVSASATAPAKLKASKSTPARASKAPAKKTATKKAPTQRQSR